MLDDAEEIAAADEDANTLFSIHMYAVYTEPQAVIDYFDAFAAKSLPLIVGEYGDGFGDESVPWDVIQAEAEERGIGWIAWSYSGNTDGGLDQVVDFDPARMTTWGERVFDSEHGIGNTSERATVFDGDAEPTEEPTEEPAD